MWMFLIIVSLLDQNRATLLPGKYGVLQLILQQQLAQTAITPSPDTPQQRTSSSSSSSSSSSDSSESSQSSKGFQLMKEPQKLENTAAEQLDLSQESSEVLLPTSLSSSTNLQLSEPVLLGQRAVQTDGHTEDVEGQDKVVLHTFHHLLSPNAETTQITEVGGDLVEGGVSIGHVGGAGEQAEAWDDAETNEEKINGFPYLSDNSMEGAHELTYHLPGYHGDEAGLELAL